MFVLGERVSYVPGQRSTVLSNTRQMLSNIRVVVDVDVLRYLCLFWVIHFQFKLSPMVLGLMFVINGGTYALTAPWWGWLCDKVLPPKFVTLLGCIVLVIGFSLIGPVPFLDMPTWVQVIFVVVFKQTFIFLNAYFFAFSVHIRNGYDSTSVRQSKKKHT